jgi:hypothetical protein
MTITRCPRCQRHCFTDARECQECALVFELGLLNRQSDAKEGRFLTKSYVLFAGLFVIPVILAVVQLSGLLGH